MRSNRELLAFLKCSGAIKSERIFNAFDIADRIGFVPLESQKFAYNDVALPLPASQSISQPSTVAMMLELLGVQEGEHVLDIGVGSGWSSSLLSYLVGETGTVLGLELLPELLEYSTQNISKLNRNNIVIRQAGDKRGETYFQRCPGFKFVPLIVRD